MPSSGFALAAGSRAGAASFGVNRSAKGRSVKIGLGPSGASGPDLPGYGEAAKNCPTF